VEKSFYGGHLTKTAITKGVESENQNFYITGVMSSPVVDLENEVIDSTAYGDAIRKVKMRKSNGNPLKIFLEHRRKELSIPLGTIEDAWHDESKGLMFKGRIANSSVTEPIKELIREGVLQGVSIGGECLKAIPYFDPKVGKDIKKIVKMDLRELSLTGLPVNEDAIFSMSKSLHCSGKCGSNSINKSCGECGPECYKNKAKEVKFLVGKLNKAITTERSIQTLEKAAQMAEEGKPIGAEDAKRIEEALKNLGGLLGIELEGGAKTSEVGLPPVEETPTEQQPVEDVQEQEIPQPKSEPAPEPSPEPAPEESATTAPSGALNYTEAEDAVMDEDGDDSSKAIVNPEQDVEGKLNRIIELLTKKEDVCKDSDDSFEAEIDAEDTNTEEGGEKMENVTRCAKCNLAFNKSQVEYDVNFCPICGDNIGAPAEKSLSKSCPECSSVFTKSFDTDAALEADYDLIFCPQCGARLVDGKHEGETEEPNEESSEEIQDGGEEMQADSDIDADEDLMIDLDKALASIAVASSPKGAKTVRDGVIPDKSPAAKTAYPSKEVKGLGSIKTADSPDGAKTKFTTKAKEEDDVNKNLEVETKSHDGESGPAVAAFDDKFVDPSDGKRTDNADSTLHEHKESYFQPMEGSAPEERWKNYGKDKKIGKSALEEEVVSLRKSIDELKSVATRKGIVTNTVLKSDNAPTQDALDRHLAQVFIGKLKA
jgi:HK97 family phage prohead protease